MNSFFKFIMQLVVIATSCSFLATQTLAQEFKLLEKFTTKIDIDEAIYFVKDKDKIVVSHTNESLVEDKTNNLGIIEISGPTHEVAEFKVPYHAESLILDIAQVNDSLFILSYEKISFFKKKGETYELISEFFYRKRFDITIDRIFYLKPNTLLLASEYNFYQNGKNGYFDKLRFYTLEIDKMKRIKKIPFEFDIGIGMLYTYYNFHQWIDILNGHIVIADPLNSEIKLFDTDFKNYKNISIPNQNSGTADTLRKYFTNAFLKETLINPKQRIHLLDDIHAEDLEYIEKIFFITDDIIGISKTQPDLTEKSRMLYYFDLKTDSFIYNKPILIYDSLKSELAPNSLMYSYYFFPNSYGEVISANPSLNLENEPEVSLNLYKVPQFSNGVILSGNHTLLYKDSSLTLSDYEEKPAAITKNQFDYVIFSNLYICFHCFHNKDRIAFIYQTNKDDSKLSRLVKTKRIKKDFPNSGVFFTHNIPEDFPTNRLIRIIRE